MPFSQDVGAAFFCVRAIVFLQWLSQRRAAGIGGMSRNGAEWRVWGGDRPGFWRRDPPRRGSRGVPFPAGPAGAREGRSGAVFGRIRGFSGCF